jgi:hypothetical protein
MERGKIKVRKENTSCLTLLAESAEYVENGIIKRVQLRASRLFITDPTADAVERGEVQGYEQNCC